MSSNGSGRRPGPDQFDFRQLDAIADYATSHGFTLRGHTLFWTPTKWYPKWLARMHFGLQPAMPEALADQARADRLPPLRKRIYSYDVVNEAVQPETGEIRDTNVTRALGRRALPRPDVPHGPCRSAARRNSSTTII